MQVLAPVGVFFVHHIQVHILLISPKDHTEYKYRSDSIILFLVSYPLQGRLDFGNGKPLKMVRLVTFVSTDSD